MRLIVLIALSCSLGCATKRLVREDVGKVIKPRIQVDKVKLPESIELTQVEVYNKKNPKIKLKLSGIKQFEEKWTDKVLLERFYEKRCRGWKGSYSFAENEDYCSMNWLPFFVYHALAYGFLYDLTIPFQSFEDKKIEISELDKSPSEVEGHRIIKNNFELDNQLVTFTFNEKKVVKKLVNGQVVFSFKSLGYLNEDEILLDSAQIKVGHNILDITEKINKYLKNKAEKKRRKIALEKQSRINKAVCSRTPFVRFLVGNINRRFERDCVYLINNDDNYRVFYVLQSLPGKLLVDLRPQFSNGMSRTFIVQTSKSYVDNDTYHGKYLKYLGVTTYLTAFGLTKTVHKFKEVYF